MRRKIMDVSRKRIKHLVTRAALQAYAEVSNRLPEYRSDIYINKYSVSNSFPYKGEKRKYKDCLCLGSVNGWWDDGTETSGETTADRLARELEDMTDKAWEYIKNVEE